jgi:hypothetical protein
MRILKQFLGLTKLYKPRDYGITEKLKDRNIFSAKSRIRFDTN